jgi:hypothetical protein
VSRFFTSLGCLGLLALGCSANNDVERDNGGVGGSGFVSGAGGSRTAGFDVANAGNGANLTGGKTIATADIIEKIASSTCAGTSSELEVPPALLEFVVDVSGSMSEPAPGAIGQSKWDITQAALLQAIDSNLPDVTGVGILLFPNMDTTSNHNDKSDPPVPLDTSMCVNTTAMVAVGPLGAAGSKQRADIANCLAKGKVAGGTPTDDAFEYAYSNGVSPALITYANYAPFMVLITDGQPTILLHCEGMGSEAYPVDSHPIVTTLTAIREATPTVKTFVIGSPGSEAQATTSADGRSWLSQAARAGGTPHTPNCDDNGPNYCHFDLTQSQDFATDLATALTEIINEAVPCTVKIPPPADGGTPDPNKINVVYEENVINGTPTQLWLIGQTTDTGCAEGTADGWYVDPNDPNQQTMVLCPTTCKTVRMDRHAVLNVRQGCRTVVPSVT